jgi:hypothetical protein
MSLQPAIFWFPKDLFINAARRERNYEQWLVHLAVDNPQKALIQRILVGPIQYVFLTLKSEHRYQAVA